MSESFVIVPSDKLRAMCQNTLDHIWAERIAMAREDLEKYTWFDRLLKRKRPERLSDDRVKWWIKAAYQTDLHCTTPMSFFRRQEDVAKHLLRACDFADEVQVSIWDLDQVS